MTRMTHVSTGDISVMGGRAAILVHIADDAMRAHDWDQAQAYFHQARDLTTALPHNSGKMHYISLNLARIEYRKGNYSNALRAIENLVPSIDWLMPSDIEMMADCHESLKNTAQALVFRQAALDAQAELESF